MGMIGRMLGGAAAVQVLGNTVQGLAGAFVPNATRSMEIAGAAYQAAMESHSAEFRHPRPGWFDRLMNGLNRLPRPALAMGTLGLFVYAMVDPVSFAGRMQGLAYVPEPLWWLLGAIVSFYFGAREMHYIRRQGDFPAPPDAAQTRAAPAPEGNPALAEWRGTAAAERNVIGTRP
jgi:hypothetical protein